MRAALPMYDQPAPRTQTDAWWRGLARAFEESLRDTGK